MTRDGYITLYRCGHHRISVDHRAPGFCPACAPGLGFTYNTNLAEQARTERALPTDRIHGVLDEFPDGVYDDVGLLLAAEKEAR